MFEKSSLSIETELICDISKRFKKLRGNTPADLISTQKGTVNRIENGKNTTSGNFVTYSILCEYSDYFGIEKERLIFGNDKELELILKKIFLKIASSIGLEDTFPLDVTTVITNIFRIFSDFNRWYKIKRFEANVTDSEIDFESMFEIFWRLMKNKIILSFKEHVVKKVLDESNQQFKFNQIDKEFTIWYYNDFAKSIVPTSLEKLKTNSIFKIGFMVDNLIDEHFVTNIPNSYLEDVPLEEFYLPSKTISFTGGKQSEEAIQEMARFINDASQATTIERILEWDKKKYFEGIESIDYHEMPFINQTKKVKITELLKRVLETPETFNDVHNLNRTNEKISGILTVNSQTSNLFQEEFNKVILKLIDDLVRYQNNYINFIKWEELETFL